MTSMATMANQGVKVSKNGVVCVEHGRRIARIREGKLLFTVNAPPTQEQLAAKVRAREAGEHVSHIIAKKEHYAVDVADLPDTVKLYCNHGRHAVRFQRDDWPATRRRVLDA